MTNKRDKEDSKARVVTAPFTADGATSRGQHYFPLAQTGYF
jgi:hypothetical protein